MSKVQWWKEAVAAAMLAVLCAMVLWFQAFAQWNAISWWPGSPDFGLNLQLSNLEKTGFGDWQQFHHWWELGYVSITRYGELPLWDPYHCGGVPNWGQPQAQNFGPTYWLTGLVFGTTLGTKLFLMYHTIAGFLGIYVLCRSRERLTILGSAFAAFIWCGSGFFIEKGSGGHSTFLPFYFFPWLLWTWYRAQDDMRFVGVFALIVGLIFSEGGTYPIPFAIIVLAVDTVLRRPIKWRSIVKNGLIGGVLVLFVGAYRWVPIMVTFSRHPRTISDRDMLSLWEVIEMLTSRDHSWGWVGHEYNWGEYGGYVGWGAIALFLVGFIVSIAERRIHLYLAAPIYLLLVMGKHDWYWPASLLHRLPVFDSMRVSSRWQVVFALVLSMLAGLALSRMERAKWSDFFGSRWLGRSIALAIAVVLVIDVYAVGAIHSNRWWGEPLRRGTPETTYFIDNSARYEVEYANFPWRNVGSLGCYDPLPWERSDSMWAGREPQVRVRDDQGKETQLREGDSLDALTRTTNTIHLEISLKSPARVILNQNWEFDWQATPVAVTKDESRLAVDLPAGHCVVDFRYSPNDLPWSVLATIAGVLACLIVIFRPQLRNLIGRFRRPRDDQKTPTA